MRYYKDIQEAGAFGISSAIPAPDGVQADYQEAGVRDIIDHVRDTVKKFKMPDTTEVSIMTERGLNPSISNVVSPKWQHRLGELSRYDGTFYTVPVKRADTPAVLVGYIRLDNGEERSTNYVVNLVVPKE